MGVFSMIKKFFLDFVKREIFWFKGALSDIFDRYNLWAVDSKIDLLKEEVAWEDSGKRRREIFVEMILYSEDYNRILCRIRDRETRHAQVEVH